MKIMAGGALNHRKPSPAPTKRSAQHREFARPFDEMQLQVIGENRVADKIDDDAEARRRDHHRHDGKPVKTIRDVDGIARADDNKIPTSAKNGPK